MPGTASLASLAIAFYAFGQVPNDTMALRDECVVSSKEAYVQLGDKIVAVLHKGHSCTVTKIHGDWIKIETIHLGKDVEGYIKKSNLVAVKHLLPTDLTSMPQYVRLYQILSPKMANNLELMLEGSLPGNNSEALSEFSKNVIDLQEILDTKNLDPELKSIAESSVEVYERLKRVWAQIKEHPDYAKSLSHKGNIRGLSGVEVG